uniref:Uncharacterized protein n=1 Tax=Strongyloides venezuelensis TaxID=75913 RepID=A0A0K0G5T3_STRVS
MHKLTKNNDNVLECINENSFTSKNFVTQKVVTKALCEFKEAFTEKKWNPIYLHYLKESVCLRSLMVVWPFIGVARPPATCIPADTC